MTPCELVDAWVAAKTASALRVILTAPDMVLPPACWVRFWATYSPGMPAPRRPPAVHFASEQNAAAEAALRAAVGGSSRLQAAVARTYTRDYWLAVYGGVEREVVARRQVRHLVTLAAPGWAADPSWLTPTVVALARQIRESRDFSAMPILADALQDAGCGDDEWLAVMRDATWPWFQGTRVLDTLF